MYAGLEKPRTAMEILMRTSTFATGRVDLVSESSDIFVLYVTIFHSQEYIAETLGALSAEVQREAAKDQRGRWWQTVLQDPHSETVKRIQVEGAFQGIEPNEVSNSLYSDLD